MKAVAYYRVSTAEQEQEGYSLPAQRERIRKFAISQGYTIVREFWDVMTASGVKRRKGFREMIEFLKKNPDVRVVIAAKVDRLFRNFKDYVTLYDIEGIKVVFSDERIPDGATGQFLMESGWLWPATLSTTCARMSSMGWRRGRSRVYTFASCPMDIESKTDMRWWSLRKPSW